MAGRGTLARRGRTRYPPSVTLLHVPRTCRRSLFRRGPLIDAKGVQARWEPTDSLPDSS